MTVVRTPRDALGHARIAFTAGVFAAATLTLGALPARAGSATVAIRYGLTIAGLPIGTASLNADVTDRGPYRISVSAKIGGILALVSDGKGTATSSGRLGEAALDPAAYALNSVSSGKQQTVQMAVSGGGVTRLAVNPPVPPRADRIDLTSDDERGIIDPLSAMLVAMPGSGSLVSSKACERTLPVFDGGQRFDVALSFARTETVEVKDYSGPAVVCTARYHPIAGHRPEREQTRFMVANTDMELWLAPVAGTRVLAPARIIIGTQVGRLVVDAARLTVASR